LAVFVGGLVLDLIPMDGAYIVRVLIGGEIAPTAYVVFSTCLGLVKGLVGALEYVFRALTVIRKRRHTHTRRNARVFVVGMQFEVLDSLTKALGEDASRSLVGLRTYDDELVASDSGGDVDPSQSRVQIFPEQLENLSSRKMTESGVDVPEAVEIHENQRIVTAEPKGT
jgi:hypothetical protein